MYVSTSLCLPLRHLILPAFTLVGNKRNYISKLETWVNVSGLRNIMFSDFWIFNGWDSNAAALKHGTEQGLQDRKYPCKNCPLLTGLLDICIHFEHSHALLFEDLLVINRSWPLFYQLTSVLNFYFLAFKNTWNMPLWNIYLLGLLVVFK